MRVKSMMQTAVLGLCGTLALAGTAYAQGAGGPGTPWRGAGPQPCYGDDAGVYQCPPPPAAVAVGAARVLDTKTGQIAVKQTILIQGDRIVDVGPEAQVKVPANAQVID